MIKVTLPNGVVIEADSSQEANDVIDFLHSDPISDMTGISDHVINQDSKQISLSSKNFEVYDVISLFPQGVSARNIGNLLNLKITTVNSRIQQLKEKGVVIRVPHKELWSVSEGVASGEFRIVCPDQMG